MLTKRLYIPKREKVIKNRKSKKGRHPIAKRKRTNGQKCSRKLNTEA